ncbi:MAG: YceI family protein [Aestuariivita sp.]|nr:YceI family protein [Aestuariivita sp.]
MTAIFFSGISVAVAEPVKFELDASHSQIIFSYNHLGFSTTTGMFSGFEGEILFDQENPANSSVKVAMPVLSMFTGWEARDQHFLSDDFFGATTDNDLIEFTSTLIEVTGENTAIITGDLSIVGVIQPVVLQTTLNKAGPFPFGPKAGTQTLGFDATTTLKRSDFNLGKFSPAVSDAVEIQISIEALQAD